MIIRTLSGTIGTELDVHGPTWNSRRLLVAADEMPYSMTDTVVKAGSEQKLWYKHHLEACYCIEGTGSISDTANGATHQIGPGTLYALDRHDQHVLKAVTDIRMICVFSPPLTGHERHDDDGSYELPD
ncbi:MAG: ectoine synthase [Gammaproteobacteria bacterium]|nr:ectoine synthase [Gammaproteobacteria bacterium]